MNKSKFLKKSLAMLLALMLVLAMIPLSASAAPSGQFKVTASGDVTETADGWNVAYDYSATLPSVSFETAAGESVDYVDEDGNTQDVPATNTVQLWRDDDGVPAPLTIKVDNNGEVTEHVIRWSMAAAAGPEDVSVEYATIGDGTNTITGSVDGNTINFVIPFGVNWDADDIAINFNNVLDDRDYKPTGLTVETNTTKGVEGKITVTSQRDGEEVEFFVNVKWENALTAITLGDYEGKFQVKPDTDPDAGKAVDNNYIDFIVPNRDVDVTDLTTSFTVGSAFTSIVYNDGTNHDMVNGQNGNYDQAMAPNRETITLTNAYGGEIVYRIGFIVTTTDTEITALTATIGTDVYDGTVDGENLEVIVPADANLRSVKVTFTGPIGDTNKPKIGPASGSTPAEDEFDANCEASLTISNYTAPIRLVVTSADGTVKDYYTLTITKAEAPQNDPRVTSAKVVLNPDQEDEYTATGDIDQEKNTITFEVPYSTTEAMVRDANYAFAKTSQTSWTSDAPTGSTSWKLEGSKLGVKSNDNTTEKTYTIVFDRMDPQTGKTISNFQLSTSDNEYEKAYNNNKNFDVTVSGNEFKVTVPTSQTGNLYPSFELSQGAALYKVAGTAAHAKDALVSTFVEVNDYDAIDGDYVTALTASDYADGYVYFIADEKLAYDIENNNDTKALTYDQMKNTYKGNYTEYTLKVTKQDNTEHRLLTLSADDGLVTATFEGDDRSIINLSVPYSYAKNGTPFFFDFTTSEGATFGPAWVYSGSTVDVPAISGGAVSYNGTELVADPATYTAYNADNNNIAFAVKETSAGSGEYALYWGGTTPNFDTDTTYGLRVIAEDGGFTAYTIGKITVRDAETGANLTSAKVNNTQATINNTANTVTVSLPYGTNLGQTTLTLAADKLASIQVDTGSRYSTYDPDAIYDLTKGAKIQVTAENGDTKKEYALTATLGDMFSDVAEDQWYYDYVLEAAELGIVKGNPDGTFKPNDKVTRADFALMTVRMLGVDEDSLEFTTTAFTDVNDETYNAAAIQYCAEKGLIGGDGDGKFRPNDSITRQEAAKIIAEALELTETDDELFTDDNLIHEWAEDYVYQCKAAGIFGGDAGTGNFRPTDAISRAETAKIMVVAYNNK